MRTKGYTKTERFRLIRLIREAVGEDHTRGLPPTGVVVSTGTYSIVSKELRHRKDEHFIETVAGLLPVTVKKLPAGAIFRLQHEPKPEDCEHDCVYDWNEIDRTYHELAAKYEERPAVSDDRGGLPGEINPL